MDTLSDLESADLDFGCPIRIDILCGIDVLWRYYILKGWWAGYSNSLLTLKQNLFVFLLVRQTTTNKACCHSACYPCFKIWQTMKVFEL